MKRLQTFGRLSLIIVLCSSFGAIELAHGIDGTACRGNPPDVLWEKTLGGTSYDSAYDVIETLDGGYCIAASSQSYGGRKALLIKTDADGNQLWLQTYLVDTMAYAHGIEQTTDGGFILAGHDYSSARNWDVYLIKTDVDGVVEWEKTYGGTNLDYGYSVQQTSDGGFVIGGVTLSYGAGSYDAYVIKTDANGNEQWSETYGGVEEEFGYDVRETSDGGFVLVGFTDTFSVGNAEYAVYLVKIDASGNEQWYKTYGEDLLNRGQSILVVPEGGYIIAGHAGDNACLISTDSQGNLNWLTKYGDGIFNDVSRTREGGFIMTGETSGLSQEDLYVVKANNHGDELWSQTLGGTDQDSGSAVIQDSAGYHVVAGSTKSFGYGYRDIYLVKTDSLPIVDIKANGLDSPITVGYGSNLLIELSLDPRFEAGNSADWWVLAGSPFGWYRYNLGILNFVPGFGVSYQGPLSPFGPYTAYNGTTLPAGSYTLYFGVDMEMDGDLDMDSIYYDFVDVTVQ